MLIVHELHLMLRASGANELKGDSVFPPFQCQYVLLIRYTIKTKLTSGVRDSNTFCMAKGKKNKTWDQDKINFNPQHLLNNVYCNM